MSPAPAKRPEYLPEPPAWAIWPHMEALDKERRSAEANGRPVYRLGRGPSADRFELTDKGREATS